MEELRIAIVDYGLGNLFSVQRACEQAGLPSTITPDPAELERADGIILPGVGAFGDAMDTLHRRGLVEPLKRAAESGKPLMGVCLGIQLLMGESEEFGRHEGLGLLKGRVVRFGEPRDGERRLKVPQVCWNRVNRPAGQGWQGTPLEGLADGEYMYFVHSFYVQPEDPSVILTTTRYGHVEFCSSVLRGNVFACQFHPERSGAKGLAVYRGWASTVRRARAQGATG